MDDDGPRGRRPRSEAFIRFCGPSAQRPRPVSVLKTAEVFGVKNEFAAVAVHPLLSLPIRPFVIDDDNGECSNDGDEKMKIENMNSERNCKLPENLDNFNHSTRFARTTIENNRKSN